MIKYLIEKEFKQTLRNSFLPRIMILFPLMLMLVFPWAANLEIKDVSLSIIDQAKSPLSERLTQQISSSAYFIAHSSNSYEEAMKEVEKGTTDAILILPSTFERDLQREDKGASVQIVANAVNGTKGAMSSMYLSQIVSDFNRNNGTALSPISVVKRFNATMDYKIFMIPALMVMVLTMLCGFLPALNIVSEKEKGTIEQINVSPISKFTFILAKLIPYWLLGFGLLTFCFGLVYAVYGLAPIGSFLTIYACATLYVLTISGVGLIVSNYSSTMQQSMFVMYFFVFLFMLMSGLFTPIKSMPFWAQCITYLNPLRFMMEIMRAVYLKGSVLSDLLPQIGMLSLFAIVLNSWAVFSYRKTL